MGLTSVHTGRLKQEDVQLAVVITIPQNLTSLVMQLMLIPLF